MQIQPINNSTTTNYYNNTKSNKAQAFKGTYLKRLSEYDRSKLDISEAKMIKINKFFEKYFSPGVNVIGNWIYETMTFVPWLEKFNEEKKLAIIPHPQRSDIKFYTTNVKAIEDEVLNMTMNYFKTDENVARDKDKYLTYIQKQREYALKEENAERLPLSYLSKLALFEDLVNRQEH